MLVTLIANLFTSKSWREIDAIHTCALTVMCEYVNIAHGKPAWGWNVQNPKTTLVTDGADKGQVVSEGSGGNRAFFAVDLMESTAIGYIRVLLATSE